jgi:hypothetical protein
MVRYDFDLCCMVPYHPFHCVELTNLNSMGNGGNRNYGSLVPHFSLIQGKKIALLINICQIR